MSKLTILKKSNNFTVFESHYLESIFSQYFNICEFDETKTYDKANTIVIANYRKRESWVDELQTKGYKILFDDLWESEENDSTKNGVWKCSNWFWYNESLWYKSLGYDKYVPNKTYTHTALMPLKRIRRHRDELFREFTKYLDRFIYSYVDRGIILPNDRNVFGPGGQRYLNTDWYDNTYYSIVSETYVNERLITEKTFKPIAYYHPFLIYGHHGVLRRLKNLGFETFENLFNESYDDLELPYSRLKEISNNVKNFVEVPYDKITLEKLDHNHNRFFNTELVLKKFTEEVINPLIEYAETK